MHGCLEIVKGQKDPAGPEMGLWNPWIILALMSRSFCDIRGLRNLGMPSLSTDTKMLDLETGLEELPRGEDGEIAASGPQIMLGYWNKPGADEEVF